MDATAVRAHQHAAWARHRLPADVDPARLAPAALSDERSGLWVIRVTAESGSCGAPVRDGGRVAHRNHSCVELRVVGSKHGGLPPMRGPGCCPLRGGRHSLEGWSNVTGGIVIDISEMKSAWLDPASRTVTVGAGFTQGEVATTLGGQGFAVPTGGEATVGLAGATLGGGLGFLTRNFGMACDNLMAAEVVVPSGDDGAKVRPS